MAPDSAQAVPGDAVADPDLPLPRAAADEAAPAQGKAPDVSRAAALPIQRDASDTEAADTEAAAISPTPVAGLPTQREPGDDATPPEPTTATAEADAAPAGVDTPGPDAQADTAAAEPNAIPEAADGTREEAAAVADEVTVVKGEGSSVPELAAEVAAPAGGAEEPLSRPAVAEVLDLFGGNTTFVAASGTAEVADPVTGKTEPVTPEPAAEVADPIASSADRVAPDAVAEIPDRAEPAPSVPVTTVADPVAGTAAPATPDATTNFAEPAASTAPPATPDATTNVAEPAASTAAPATPDATTNVAEPAAADARPTEPAADAGGDDVAEDRARLAAPKPDAEAAETAARSPEPVGPATLAEVEIVAEDRAPAKPEPASEADDQSAGGTAPDRVTGIADATVDGAEPFGATATAEDEIFAESPTEPDQPEPPTDAADPIPASTAPAAPEQVTEATDPIRENAEPRGAEGDVEEVAAYVADRAGPGDRPAVDVDGDSAAASETGEADDSRNGAADQGRAAQPATAHREPEPNAARRGPSLLHLPALAAVAAVARFGPGADSWAREMRAAYPAATADALARLAQRRFVRRAAVAGAAASVFRWWAPAAEVATGAWVHADLVMHIAAAYETSATAVDLLVVTGLHADDESARAAVAVATGEAVESETAVSLSLPTMAKAASWTGLGIVTRVWPGLAAAAGASTASLTAERVAARAISRFDRRRATARR